MGDWFQRLADVQATGDEAAALGADLVKWLLKTEVVAGEPVDECVLGGTGYRPGRRYAEALADPAEDWFLKFQINGVEVVTERTVFDAGQGELCVLCPRCLNEVEFDDVIEPGIAEWWSGAGNGDRACPRCGARSALNEWDWQPPWAFGYLGLEFWNWPPLSERFIDATGKRLGHRLVPVLGKL